jgi:Domain of unknown function (DU1801)
MARSSATTVGAYLEELPAERRAVISAVRDTILRHLPDGYVESMNWGMISYEVPWARFSETGNGQPLSYAALAAQKNYYAVYLMNVYQGSYGEGRLKAGFAKAGKKLDMGKSCVRFRGLDDLPLDVIGEAIASTPVDEHIRVFETARSTRR